MTSEGQNQFVKTLESIFAHTEDSDSLSSLPVSLFYGQINDIETINAEENIKQFEKRLFELKNNLQVIFNLFKDYETAIISKRAQRSQVTIRELGGIK